MPDPSLPIFDSQALIRLGLHEMQTGRIEYLHPDPVKIVLTREEFRSHGLPDLSKWAQYDQEADLPAGENHPESGDAVLYRERPTYPLPERTTQPRTDPLRAWPVGMSSPFLRQVADLDGSLQNRILLAIRDLCAAPRTPVLNVREPLGGERKGLWGYATGDYRIVYAADAEKRRVTLLIFEERMEKRP